MVEGTEEIVWPRGSVQRKQTVSFQLQQWQAAGGAAAKSQAATKYLLKQLEELASSRDQQPAYIQWSATADPAASLNASDLHDGWYIIDNFDPDYKNFVVSGIVTCRMTVTEVAAGAPRSVAMAYAGGALSTNYGGTGVNLLSAPAGSTLPESNFTRTGGEGGIPTVSAPAASPEPVVLSATLSNIFKGGAHAYDTINTSSNPVPVAGGTYVHANWVEVFDTHHDFVGDCVVTNGLQLLLFQVGVSVICTAYLWNTALATPTWQQYATVKYQDNPGNVGVLRSYSLIRVGPEEVAIKTSSSNVQAAEHVVRLQRGRYDVRIAARPTTQANTAQWFIRLANTAGTLRIIYHEAAIVDNIVQGTSLANSLTNGWTAAFVPSNSFPIISGLLYQNKPASQPGGTANAQDLGDTSGPALNEQRSYGLYAFPYGASGGISTQDLWFAASTGTFDAGWSSVADAGAAGGNAAKLASGTVVGRNVYGTVPPAAPDAGSYQVWYRLKVTSAASGTVCFRAGVYDQAAGWVAGQYTDYAPSSLTTGWVWYRVANTFTPAAGQYQRFIAGSITNTTTTDIFVDQAALVPITLSSNRGPQQNWQNWMYDRSVRLIRP